MRFVIKLSIIVLPVEFSRLLAGKDLYNNRLQPYSREFITLKGIVCALSSFAHRLAESCPRWQALSP